MEKILLKKFNSGDFDEAKSENDFPLWELKKIDSKLLSPSKTSNRASMRQKTDPLDENLKRK